MQKTSSIKRPAHVPEPKHFDWFMGLLYLIGAIGFAMIVALFYALLSGQPPIQ